MLFVVGVTFLMIGVTVAAAAAMVFQDRIGPPSVQHLVNNAVLSVILAMFVGTGLMILFLFIVEFKDQTFGIMEAVLAVVIAAAHQCMTTRGVHKSGVVMVTSRMLGAFRDNPSTRREFLAMVGSPSGGETGFG